MRIITRADGILCLGQRGQKILDAMSGLWCVNAGYGRGELAEAAYRQLLELPYYNSFFQTTDRPSVRLAALSWRLAPPVGGRHVPAMCSFQQRLGEQRHQRAHGAALLGPWGSRSAKVIISRFNAYHGSTMAVPRWGA